ncbi:MAG: FAD-binding protein [Dermatophilaceae bacterium]
MSMTGIGPTRIGQATIAEFAAGLRGDAIRPGDGDYDLARSIWNGAHDRHPALIVRCAGVADVIRTVDLARSEGLPLAVRGGGHSIPGSPPSTTASCSTWLR